MRRLMLLGALVLAGCSGNLVGPFSARPPQRVDDPLISIPEQEKRGRDRLAYPDESPIKTQNLAPPTYLSPPNH
jgi:hypothetical protein